MHNGLIQDCATCSAVSSGPEGEHVSPQVLKFCRRHIVVCVERDPFPIEAVQSAKSGITEPHRPLDDGIEYRLYVGQRTADDLKDLTGRGLLLQCLGHLRMGLG